MKLHSYWAQYHHIYASTASWTLLWLRSAPSIRSFPYPKHVRRLVTTLPTKKNVRKSGFATLLLYNIPQAESSAVAAATNSYSAASSDFLESPALFPRVRSLFGLNATGPLCRPSQAFSRALLMQSLRSYHSSDTNPSDPNIPFSTEPKGQPHTHSPYPNAAPGSGKRDPETHLVVKDAGGSTLQHYQPAGISPDRRATKQELLARAQSTIGRVGIHVRWALFKQIRPMTTDDLSALFSWILVGNIIWILLGTTTFFSLVLFTMNTVFAQEYIAEHIGNFVTKNTGLTVVFENAIVPHWSDGVISFNNVFVSRRPHRGNHRVQKGSQAEAAAAASHDSGDEMGSENEDTGNYTQFDLTIDNVSVTLSLSKWMNGGGIVKDVEVRGLRGIVDRRHVRWDPDDDPVLHKNVHKPGDFEIENFKMEDALVTLYHPKGFRPFRVSIFNCELPRLRKHWLFYDILSATSMTGTYDNSLFTIHPRQLESVSSYDKSVWKKINRLRIDAVNIDHLNKGVQGPFGWIESGNVDLCADIMFPAEEENLNFAQVLRDIKTSWNRVQWAKGTKEERDRYAFEETERANYVLEDGEWKRKVVHAESTPLVSFHTDPNALAASKYMVVDLRVQLNNSRAAVPLFTSDLTYINNALIRPIVAYINSRDTYIPINCRIIKKYDDFEGSWTLYDSRLMDDISAAVYDAFAASIMDDDARAMRMRKIGFWSLQLALQLFLVSLGALA